MITVAESRPVQVEAIRFTGDNIDEVRRAVEFTGHTFRVGPNPFAAGNPPQTYYINVRPGVILTVVRGEWLVYNLSDATWRVYNDKEFRRGFELL